MFLWRTLKNLVSFLWPENIFFEKYNREFLRKKLFRVRIHKSCRRTRKICVTRWNSFPLNFAVFKSARLAPKFHITLVRYRDWALHNNTWRYVEVFFFYFSIFFYFQNSPKTPKEVIRGRGSHFQSFLRKGIEDIRRKQLLRTINN